MSSEIYYDRAFIRVDDRYIPIVKHETRNTTAITAAESEKAGTVALRLENSAGG